MLVRADRRTEPVVLRVGHRRQGGVRRRGGRDGGRREAEGRLRRCRLCLCRSRNCGGHGQRGGGWTGVLRRRRGGGWTVVLRRRPGQCRGLRSAESLSGRWGRAGGVRRARSSLVQDGCAGHGQGRGQRDADRHRQRASPGLVEPLQHVGAPCSSASRPGLPTLCPFWPVCRADSADSAGSVGLGTCGLRWGAVRAGRSRARAGRRTPTGAGRSAGGRGRGRVPPRRQGRGAAGRPPAGGRAAPAAPRAGRPRA